MKIKTTFVTRDGLSYSTYDRALEHDRWLFNAKVDRVLNGDETFQVNLQDVSDWNVDEERTGSDRKVVLDIFWELWRADKLQ